LLFWAEFILANKAGEADTNLFGEFYVFNLSGDAYEFCKMIKSLLKILFDDSYQ